MVSHHFPLLQTSQESQDGSWITRICEVEGSLSVSYVLSIIYHMLEQNDSARRRGSEFYALIADVNVHVHVPSECVCVVYWGEFLV